MHDHFRTSVINKNSAVEALGVQGKALLKRFRRVLLPSQSCSYAESAV